MVERIPHARKQQLLPVILSSDEVVRFFAAVPSHCTDGGAYTAERGAFLAPLPAVRSRSHWNTT